MIDDLGPRLEDLGVPDNRIAEILDCRDGDALHGCYLCCSACNTDTHICLGCGANLNHGIDTCMRCRREIGQGQ